VPPVVSEWFCFGSSVLVVYWTHLDEKTGWVLVNGKPLFQATRPFRYYLDRRKSGGQRLEALRRTPSESFQSSYTLCYSVVLNKNFLARMYPRYTGGFKCHSIYGTYGSGRLFKSKALENIIDNSLELNSVYSRIARYLVRVIRRVYESYGFEYVLTDSEYLYMLLREESIPVHLAVWSLCRVPESLDESLTSVFHSVMETCGEVPLQYLDARVLKHVANTDVNICLPEPADCLMLTVQNNYFAGWVREFLTKEFKGKEVLPVTLFKV